MFSKSCGRDLPQPGSILRAISRHTTRPTVYERECRDRNSGSRAGVVLVQAFQQSYCIMHYTSLSLVSCCGEQSWWWCCAYKPNQQPMKELPPNYKIWHWRHHWQMRGSKNKIVSIKSKWVLDVNSLKVMLFASYRTEVNNISEGWLKFFVWCTVKKVWHGNETV